MSILTFILVLLAFAINAQATTIERSTYESSTPLLVYTQTQSSFATVSDNTTANINSYSNDEVMEGKINRMGSLDIITKPTGADVTINGASYGSTPVTLNGILVGTYIVEFHMEGYIPVKDTITVTENSKTMVSESLVIGGQISIYSEPERLDLYIDNVLVGNTPYEGIVSIGEHLLKVDKDGKLVSKRIHITEGSKNTPITLKMGPPDFTEIIHKAEFEMIGIKGGAFNMGSKIGHEREKPVHRVTLSDFYLSKTEVTQELWQAVMGKNRSHFKGSQLPVEKVSWKDAQKFIVKLNELTGKQYRLPTEAEWEYAAGGGEDNRTTYAGGNDVKSLGEYAWFWGNSRRRTQKVAHKEPNGLGLYDMSGNVSEWCSDWYESYNAYPKTNPVGGITGIHHINRGGSWDANADFCRISDRRVNRSRDRRSSLGFRLALSIE